MKKLKVGKIKRFLPKKIQTRRAGYFGLALLIIFSLFTYDIFFRSPKVKAATIGTSSTSTASGNEAQKHIVVTDRGVIVAFYNAGTQGPTGVVYSASSDNGATWGSATQVTTDQTSDFAVTIDGGNNIYISYASTGLPTNIFVKKLSYAAGTWSIGSSTQVSSASSGAASSTIAVNSSGTVYVNYIDAFCTGGCTYTKKSYYSTNLSTWTAATVNPSWSGGSSLAPMVSDGKSFWTIQNSGGWIIYADVGGTGTWVKAATAACTSTPNLSYYKDKLLMLCQNGPDGMDVSSYDIATATLAMEDVGVAGSGFTGTLVTDSQNAWAIFQGTSGSGYSINYLRYDGSSWVASGSIINDGLNNTNLNAPERVPNTANVPIIWTTGTASPYSVKASTFSTIGTVTDTGNQTGSYTGTLTGSSGDTIVKCGTWYYNTVNIVAGMTVKVCASNGQTGGNLTIYANSVTVAGTIDGSGRGMPGGVNVYGVGGTAGAQGSPATGPGANGTAGTAGSAGLSFAGGAGSGSYGGTGGSAGASAPGGASGGAGGTSTSTSTTPGNPGSGGSGSSETAGGTGGLAGYLGSGVNGDTSTDESAAFGSGGGAGGTGGSGAGAGGGGGGALTSGTTASDCAGSGGSGGKGANGGFGGKGGNGGAIVRIYASGNLSVSGAISVTGQSSTSGTAGVAGSNGTNGGAGVNSGLGVCAV